MAILPVSVLPHAKGFQNVFLGEMNDVAEVGVLNKTTDLSVSLAPTSTKSGLGDFNALFRISHDSLVVASAIRSFKATAAVSIILAALSATGKDYRHLVDFRDVREQEQRDVDDRDEEIVEGVSTIGVVGGLGLGLLWTKSPLLHP